MQKVEQRINIRFCFKLDRTISEMHAMLTTVYGYDAVTKKSLFMIGPNSSLKEGCQLKTLPIVESLLPLV